MKASELRPGNILLCGGVIDVVVLVHEQYFHLKDGGYFTFDDVYVQPVPLSFPLIQQVGFTSFREGLQDFESGIMFAKNESGTIYFKGELLDYCEMLFLHQLQNLFLIFTGEELNVSTLLS